MQLLFNFAKPPSYLLEDFIVSESNKDAFNLIEIWPNWGQQIYSKINYIYGDKSSGKTHLATLWQLKTKAISLIPKNIAPEPLNSNNCFIIENIEEYLTYEENILHIFNLIVEMKKYLLITSKIKPNELAIKLADLRSRFNAINQIKIQQPDDELLSSMIIKLFSERQLRINDQLVKYIINNSDRSFDSINQIVAKIDSLSLSLKKHPSIQMVKSILN